MRGSRSSEEQIIGILNQGEKGMATAELCRQGGISEQTYHRWKWKYGGPVENKRAAARILAETGRRAGAERVIGEGFLSAAWGQRIQLLSVAQATGQSRWIPRRTRRLSTAWF